MARSIIITDKDVNGEWFAIRDDDQGEDFARKGWGSTPEEAVKELLALEAEDEEDKPLPARDEPTDAEIARSQARIADVLGPDEIKKLDEEAF